MLDPAILIRGLPGPGVYFIYHIFVWGGGGGGKGQVCPSVALQVKSLFAVRRAGWAGAVAWCGMLKGDTAPVLGG